MADKNNDIPPIPVPSVEPAPKKRAPKPKVEAPEVAPIAPLVDLANAGSTAAHRPDPYAAAAPANPYAQQTPGYSQPTPPPGYAQPGYYAAQPGQPYAYQPYTAGPAQGLSITSMVLGIVGVLFTFGGFGLLFGIAAVITGHLAHKRQPYARPFWLTGLITGYITIAIGVVITFIIVAVILASIAAGAGSTY